ncbi:MAG: hypothetical protein ACFCVK_19695 [Acidimicrobiales bacterium]
MSEVRAILSLRIAAEFNVPIPTDGVFVDVDRETVLDTIKVRPPEVLAEVIGLAARAGMS